VKNRGNWIHSWCSCIIIRWSLEVRCLRLFEF